MKLYIWMNSRYQRGNMIWIFGASYSSKTVRSWGHSWLSIFKTRQVDVQWIIACTSRRLRKRYGCPYNRMRLIQVWLGTKEGWRCISPLGRMPWSMISETAKIKIGWGRHCTTTSISQSERLQRHRYKGSISPSSCCNTCLLSQSSLFTLKFALVIQANTILVGSFCCALEV